MMNLNDFVNERTLHFKEKLERTIKSKINELYLSVTQLKNQLTIDVFCNLLTEAYFIKYGYSFLPIISTTKDKGEPKVIGKWLPAGISYFYIPSAFLLYVNNVEEEKFKDLNNKFFTSLVRAIEKIYVQKLELKKLKLSLEEFPAMPIIDYLEKPHTIEDLAMKSAFESALFQGVSKFDSLYRIFFKENSNIYKLFTLEKKRCIVDNADRYKVFLSSMIGEK